MSETTCLWHDQIQAALLFCLFTFITLDNALLNWLNCFAIACLKPLLWIKAKLSHCSHYYHHAFWSRPIITVEIQHTFATKIRCEIPHTYNRATASIFACKYLAPLFWNWTVLRGLGVQLHTNCKYSFREYANISHSLKIFTICQRLYTLHNVEVWKKITLQIKSLGS